MVKVQQLGLNVTHAKIILLASASLTNAAAVAFSGIIGSIGLIVPHVKRQWQGVHYCQLSIISSAIALMV